MSSDAPILILKTGETLPPVKERFGDFEAWIAQGLGRAAEEVSVAAAYEGDPLPAPESLAGVVVTGSPAMVTDRAGWSEASAQWLRRVIEGDLIPAFGLCYGHQLMAHALGGEVGPNPNGREMGTVSVSFLEGKVAGDQLLEAGVFPGHMSHVESVLVAPTDAKRLATTAIEANAALQFGPRQWGVQFHPEFDRSIMQCYVEARREILAAEGHDPDGMIEGAVETPELNRVLEKFARVFVDGG